MTVIRVVGFDPSLTHWGIATGGLDLITGDFTLDEIKVIEPKALNTKQVRVNSSDLHRAGELAQDVFTYARAAKVVFAEVPVGSQSARAMCSYGICVGILASLRVDGINVIEVTATEVKKALSGISSASKEQMTKVAVGIYPAASWPRHTRNGKGFRKGDITSSAEHIADAIGAIYAGVRTPVFQTYLRLHS